MSLSPTSTSTGDLEGYETGWVALHRMLREGGSLSGRERHCAFLNLGEGRFADASAVSGLDLPDDGRAAARVDWDLDGDLDLVLTSRSGPRVELMKNEQRSGHGWLALRLEGTTCNRDAIGARVEVHLADGTRRVDSLRAGEGYLAQSSKWLHFGLADGEIEDVVVRWPTGEAGQPESFGHVPAGRRWRLVQGAGKAEAWIGPGSVDLDSTPSERPEPQTSRRIVLAARVPLPGLAVIDVTGNEAQAALAEAIAGRPALYLTWGSWCAPCVVEMGELARREEDLEGLAVVALGADEGQAREVAAGLLESMDWPHLAVFAARSEFELLDTLQATVVDRRRRLPLPSSFLVDEEGRVAVIYLGPVDVDTLLADASKLRATPEETRRAASPFPGRWHVPPPRADLGLFEARFEERGLERAAREFSFMAMRTVETSRAEVLVEFGSVHARQGRMDEAITNFGEAARLDPELFDAWHSLGAAFHELGHLGRAAKAYERALRIDPRHGPTIYNLALANFVRGERSEAEQQLALLEVIEPDMARELAAQMDELKGE